MNLITRTLGTTALASATAVVFFAGSANATGGYSSEVKATVNYGVLSGTIYDYSNDGLCAVVYSRGKNFVGTMNWKYEGRACGKGRTTHFVSGYGMADKVQLRICSGKATRSASNCDVTRWAGSGA